MTTDTTSTATVWPTLPDGRWLVLRTCDAKMKAHGGLVWPTEGHVEAPDWDPDPDRDCGGGLHGLLWGCGGGSLLSPAPDARWLLVAVDPADVANPDAPHKVRFRRGEVVLVGARDDVVAELRALGAAGLPVAYATATSGDGGTSTSGYWGTSTSGYRGTSTSGDRGTSTSGDWGTSTSGYRGTSTSGDRGTSTSGDGGTSTSGDGGTSTSGDGGTVVVRWWDAKASRYRLAVGYPGEDGIEANVPYRCDEHGRLVRADGAS